ncbi:hypothetical protein NXU87_23730 [Candidatus Bacteroides intestinigallinarum]|nr:MULTISPECIES: hypothetical protein [Bacteroides]MCS3179099.1 hypothetical protein [Candidatus Bacteroides intestinigallinarum]
MRAWGQSEPTLEQLKAAHAVTPITAVQSEYSLMERKWEADVIPLKSTKSNKKINKKYVSIIKS